VLHENCFVIERRTDLEPKIALVGSGAHFSGSWYEGTGTLLQNADVEKKEQYNAFAKKMVFRRCAYGA
jgi:hypothetical protein